MQRVQLHYEYAKATHGRSELQAHRNRRNELARVARTLRACGVTNVGVRGSLQAVAYQQGYLLSALNRPTASYYAERAEASQAFADSPIPPHLPCGTDDAEGYRRDSARWKAAVYRAATRVLKWER